MTSGTLHELFEDLYQYSDVYGQEGAHPNTLPPSVPAPASTPPSSNYRHLQSPSYPAGGATGQAYGGAPYGTGSSPYRTGGIGAGVTPAPAPPSYNDVQMQRDQVAYPYQPSHASPAYPYQPVSSPASYPSYPYPKSGSSSTSELSDISSGFGTSDGNLTGSSSAIGRSMTSPFTGAATAARPYASGGSSADSSSGLGSYSCEVPEQAESAYRSAQLPTSCGQPDSFPAPPPPEASVTTDRPNDLRPYAGDPTQYRPDLDSAIAPPPAATVAVAATTTAAAAAATTTAAAAPSSPPPPPPLPPPPPPLPPPKSWKAQQPDDAVQQHQPTRLEQQLSNMSISSDYGRQNSYQSPVPQSPSHPPGAPAPPGPAPYYGAPKTPTSPITPPAPRPQHVVPDAVLNMAAKGEPDKKPWTYAPDMESIKEQRDKVRRRAPYGGMPRYQQLLNLPKFEEAPKPRGRTPQTPPSPGQQPQQMPAASPDYEPGPGQATVAHVQYNSPLYLYSEDNVAEAFSGQTDGVVTGVGGLKKDQGKDITQSPVYRMVHGLDNEKPKQRRLVADEGAPYRPPKSPAEDDELTFSGVIDKSEIPSKSFHRLQNMTAGSEIDTTSIRQNISGEVPDDEIGAYDQASIRYTGRNIPSRSFKMLQSLTGDDTSTDLPASQPRRQRRHRPEPQPEEPEQNPDDIVDISYVGSNIPSRSFKVLQHAVGEQDTAQPASQTTPYHGNTLQNGQRRTVKVIKLRQQQPEQHTESSGVTDF